MMSEFENVVPYTQAELDQQEIWAKEFDQWWGSEGQYHRAGGNDYCRTFAWFAWLSREQSKQSEIDQLKAENLRLSGLLKEQKRCFDECSQMVSDLIKERDQLKAKKAGLEERTNKALQMLKDWDDQTFRDDFEQLIGELGDVLRGERE